MFTTVRDDVRATLDEIRAAGLYKTERVIASPQQAKSDTALRTLSLISLAHWVSHYSLLVLPMLFPFLKQQLGVGYIELGFALSLEPAELGAIAFASPSYTILIERKQI